MTHFRCGNIQILKRKSNFELPIFKSASRWCGLALALAVAFYFPFAVSAQESKENTAQVAHQKKALEIELQRMQIELELDEKQLEKIRADVAEALIASANKLRDFYPSDIVSGDTYAALLDRDLADAAHQAAEKFAKGAKLSQYREDFRKVLAWEDKYARKNVLVFLDTFLQLDPRQLTRIEKAFEDNWNPNWNVKAMRMPYDGFQACKPAIQWLKSEASVQLNDTLTDVQKKILAELKTLGGNYHRVLGLSEKDEAQLIRKDLELFLERNIEALSDKAELSEKDMSRIKIGFKGAWKKVAQLRATNNKAYNNKSSSLWFMAGLMDSGFQQMRKEILWQRTVTRILDGEVKLQYEKQEFDRQQRRLEVSAVVGIYFLSRRTPMKHRDLARLHERTAKLIKDENFSVIYRGVYTMFEQPNDFFADALYPETYSRVEEILPELRHWQRPKERTPKEESE